MMTYGLLKIYFYFLYKLMKKNTIKAFTLVEMLIVIVIIGILIAALMPRMQAAQWRARDVSRKTALSQIQSAIVTAQWDLWRWPGCDSAQSCTSGNQWMSVSLIWTELVNAWMNGVPKDPLGNNVTWLGSSGHNDYAYLVLQRNWAQNWWFALMAKTEVAWWSNWVVCDSAISGAPTEMGNWKIDSNKDVKNINLCQTLTKLDSGSWCMANTGDCQYSEDSQLRYLVTY